MINRGLSKTGQMVDQMLGVVRDKWRDLQSCPEVTVVLSHMLPITATVYQFGADFKRTQEVEELVNKDKHSKNYPRCCLNSG